MTTTNMIYVFVLTIVIFTVTSATLDDNLPYYSDTVRMQAILGLSESEISKNLEKISAEGKSRCETLDSIVFGVDKVLETKNYTSDMLCGYICSNFTFQSEKSNWLTDNQKIWVTNLSKRATADGGYAETRIRKNMMNLTRDEWSTLTVAMRRLMNDTIDGWTKFEILMQVHDTCSHTAPLFAPWHREFILRYENALREYDNSITLAYWEIPADSYLLNNEDSVTWSDSFFGNTHGTTNEGKFGYWPTPSYNCDKDLNEALGLKDGYVFRSVGQDAQHLYDDSDLVYSYSLPNYNSYVTDGSCFGNLHGSVHSFVGGTASPFGISAYEDMVMCINSINPLYDPMFIFYHTFLDYSYGQYRAYGQIEGDVESDWLDTKYTGCPTVNDQALTLKEMTNKDLLSTEYEETVRYEPRSVACESSSDCGSEFMWCSSEYRRCLSKVRRGGRCANLSSDACHHSTCFNDVCL